MASTNHFLHSRKKLFQTTIDEEKQQQSLQQQQQLMNNHTDDEITTLKDGTVVMGGGSSRGDSSLHRTASSSLHNNIMTTSTTTSTTTGTTKPEPTDSHSNQHHHHLHHKQQHQHHHMRDTDDRKYNHHYHSTSHSLFTRTIRNSSSLMRRYYGNWLVPKVKGLTVIVSTLCTKRNYFITSSHNRTTTNNNNNHNNNKHIRKDLYYTLYVFGIFLGLGCFISFLFVQYKHQKVILHVVLRDPWNHGSAYLLRRNQYYNNKHKQNNIQQQQQQVHSHVGKFHHHYYVGVPKYVTVVLPSVVNPANRLRRLEAIHSTWGSYARAIFVVHNVTDEFPHSSHLTIDTSTATSTTHHLHHKTQKQQQQHYNNNNNKIIVKSFPSDRYTYPQNLLLPTTIKPENGLERLFHTIQTIYEHVNPDYAYFVNDHTFVIPEHLCLYLSSSSSTFSSASNSCNHYDETNQNNHCYDQNITGTVLNMDPDTQYIYHGHALRQGPDKDDSDHVVLFNSGAAGYLLSRASMRILVEKWYEQDPHCYIDTTTTPTDTDDTDSTIVEQRRQHQQRMKWLQGNPALWIVDCLYTSVQVSAIDTREKPDTQNQQRRYHIFHAFPLIRVTKGSEGVDAWYVRKHQNISQSNNNKENENSILITTTTTTASMNEVYHNFTNSTATATSTGTKRIGGSTDVRKSNMNTRSLVGTTTTIPNFDDSYGTLLSGSDCCSKYTISFHYVEADECRALYRIRSILLKKSTTLTDYELYQLFQQYWPKSQQDIGYYSSPLPTTTPVFRIQDQQLEENIRSLEISTGTTTTTTNRNHTTTTTSLTSTSNDNSKDNKKQEEKKKKDQQTWLDLFATIRKISDPRVQKKC